MEVFEDALECIEGEAARQGGSIRAGGVGFIEDALVEDAQEEVVIGAHQEMDVAGDLGLEPVFSNGTAKLVTAHSEECRAMEVGQLFANLAGARHHDGSALVPQANRCHGPRVAMDGVWPSFDVLPMSRKDGRFKVRVMVAAANQGVDRAGDVRAMKKGYGGNVGITKAGHMRGRPRAVEEEDVRVQEEEVFAIVMKRGVIEFDEISGSGARGLERRTGKMARIEGVDASIAIDGDPGVEPQALERRNEVAHHGPVPESSQVGVTMGACDDDSS